MTNVVRLRLAMKGLRHRKIFHLVATSAFRPRDNVPIETLGVFDPRLKPGEETKTVEWSVDRIKYWLRRGAEPSQAVLKLLTMGGIVTPNSVYHAALRAERARKTEDGAAEEAVASQGNASKLRREAERNEG